MADRKEHLKKPAFLAALAKTGNISAAAKAARVQRRMHYEWRKIDPEYPKLVKAAMSQAIDELETEARRRAKKGSDTLLIFLLKAHRPKKYRDHQTIEHTGPKGTALSINLAVTAALDRPDMIEAYADLNGRFMINQPPALPKPAHLNGHRNGTTHN